MIRKIPKTKNDYHRPNDTWNTQEGGPKVRSLRSRRKIFTLAVTAFTVGALIIVGSSPYNNEFMAPGPLCSSHAQILAGQGADRCAACHGAADRTLASWLTDAFTGGRTIAVSQSELCMKCHEQSIVNEFALQPHNVAADELANRSSKFETVSFSLSTAAANSGVTPVNHSGEIACSACHREHHGKADLTMLTDQQCQTCHSQNYHSFETDHPEFTKWPQQRRSAIAFDHSTHAGKHFPGKKTDFNCSQCHIDDAYRNVKTLAPFEQSCAKCHDQQIQQSGEVGLAIVALPMIDTDAIERQKLDIGAWPLAATGDFDGVLPPTMRLLLHADVQAAAVLERLGPSFEFSDIDPENEEQVADAVELVWAIKRLLSELSQDGLPALRQRLEVTLGTEVDTQQIARLAGGLDGHVFQATVRRWLPDLAQELAANEREGQILKQTNSFGFGGSRTKGVRALSISFVRAQDDELAANPLAELLSGADSGKQPTESAVNQTPAEQTPERETVEDDVESQSMRLTLNDQAGDSATSDAELLAVNPLAGADPVKAMDSQPLSSERTEPPQDTLEVSSEVPSPPPITRPGWYRDDELFRVFYRPTGHADECLQAWSELAATAADADTRPATAALFKHTLSSTGIGLCATCHTVDQLSDSSFQVNWEPIYRDPSIRDFTKFSHGPHTLQPHLKDCSACHDMSNPVSNHESFIGHDGTLAVSNFAAITKMNCVNCHREGQTDNGCTQCHHYHIGSKATR